MPLSPNWFERWPFSDRNGQLIPGSGDRSLLDFIPRPQEDLDDHFHWLRNQPAHSRGKRSSFKEHLARLQASARGHGLTLPSSFARFWSAPELIDRFRSPNNASFSLRGFIEELTEAPGIYFLPILYDSQYTHFHYLVLNDQGGHCVAEWSNLRGEGPADHFGRQQTEDGPSYFSACFLDFIYHTWTENEIFYQQRKGQPLTEQQLGYRNQ